MKASAEERRTRLQSDVGCSQAVSGSLAGVQSDEIGGATLTQANSMQWTVTQLDIIRDHVGSSKGVRHQKGSGTAFYHLVPHSASSQRSSQVEALKTQIAEGIAREAAREEVIVALKTRQEATDKQLEVTNDKLQALQDVVQAFMSRPPPNN